MVTHVHKKVKSIKFQVMSPKIIKKMAVAKIVTPELYDKEGYPVDGGLMDIRLGVIDPGLICKTDGLKLKECLGHMGYIELARPVIHIEFIDLIYGMLRSTCRECGRILASDTEIAAQKRKITRTKKDRGLKESQVVIKSFITKVRNQSKCPHCKSRQITVSLEKPTRIMEKDKRLSPIEIRSRLEMIPDEDIELFGIDPESLRPEWVVLTVLAIPSVSMRPSITLQSGERSEDDLTHKLGDIVRINQRLFENINAGAPEIIIEDLWDLLQYHVTTFFNNAVVQLPPARHRSGEPLKTLSDRIKSKQGRIRHNLVGKRTNFSARSVISPDSNLKVNEVGVPTSMSTNLTVPETVNPWNMEYLKKLVQNGPDKYPGANYVTRPDGRKKRITDETKEELLEELEPGYTVERHLRDGDVALFNRQPSLHRMSMMCHKVRILDGNTFRLNTAVCDPYNADFDGDEMNLHVPQTEEARAEAETLMEVQTQMISPAFGLSVIGCKQDAVTGNLILTRDLEYPRHEAQELLYSIGVTDFDFKKDVVSGKEVFSALLPKGFDFLGEDAKGNKVVIKNGKLTQGVIDHKQLAAGSGLLLRNIHKQFGADFAANALTNMFSLGVKVLLKEGFSTGLEETDLESEDEKKIQKIIDDAYEEIDKVVSQYNSKELEVLPGRTLRETLEFSILGLLNKARNEAGQVAAKSSMEGSSVLTMAAAGHGGQLNIAQMAACVGQQSIAGGRVRDGYSNRTLTCFPQGDLGAQSRGFIKHGFKQGLGPAEFYFLSMTGRDALMDTALRTPRSGYLYRRLSNAMQDLKVEYDGTVRDSGKMIVQFSYGEDGMEVSKTEGGSINIKKIITDVMGH